MAYGFNYTNLSHSPEAAVIWAREQGLLRQNAKCSRHKAEMILYTQGESCLGGRFRCPVGRSKCKQFAATKGSLFEDIHLSFDKAIKLLYLFTRDASYNDVAHELSDIHLPPDQRPVTSHATIAAWYHYCREMICAIQGIQPKLGGTTAAGTRVVVQIDEAKFGKRKYNRGRMVDGHWVLGMIDTNSNDCRMVVVENWEATTLIPIIKEHVAVGSEIHTDCFRSYGSLADEGYVHRTVNHSVEFVADDGAHTQKIEASWRPAKDWMRGRARFHDDDFAFRLCEYLWRRYCSHNNIDMMSSLLDAIRRQFVFP